MGSTRETTYRESHTRLGKGPDYDTHFGFRHRAYLWSREQVILEDIVGRYLRDGEFDYLDFACGTGRVLAFLERRARTATGVDVSEDMLGEARKKVTKSKLIRADITREHPFGDKRFGLITAFRFFLNAEPALRAAAAKAIGGLLHDDGYFVFNNHMNRFSAVGIARGLYAGIRGRQMNTMTLSGMRSIASGAGLKVIDVYHTGVVPGLEQIMILPRVCYEALDSAFAGVGWARHLAQVQIVVCRRES